MPRIHAQIEDLKPKKSHLRGNLQGELDNAEPVLYISTQLLKQSNGYRVEILVVRNSSKWPAAGLLERIENR
jgi:hypothetical protein